MGNKTSRRRTESHVNSSKLTSTPAVPAGHQVQSASDGNKGVSCPDLAVPYSDVSTESTAGSAQRHVSYTVYRSYSNVAEASRRPEPRPDIRSLLYTFLYTSALESGDLTHAPTPRYT